MELKELLKQRERAILTLKAMQVYDFDCKHCKKYYLNCNCDKCQYFSDFNPLPEWQEAHKDVEVK